MDTSTSVRARLPATTRVARLFLKRLRGRLTLVAVLLVAVVIGAALAAIRSGATVGSVIGSESTDDAYVRADLIAVCEPIGVVIGSWLGIALSLRRMLLIGVTIFMAGSIMAAIVPGYDALLLSRIITGLAGGIIMPQAIIIQLHAWGPTRVPVALAMLLSGPTAAPQLGGVIGSWGVEHFGWSFILWAALPPGLLAFAIGYIGLLRERIRWHPLIHADLAGLFALAGALGFFACAVSQGDRMRWFETPAIPILFAASAVCLAVFLLRDWKAVRHPILWVKLCCCRRSRRNSCSLQLKMPWW